MSSTALKKMIILSPEQYQRLIGKQEQQSARLDENRKAILKKIAPPRPAPPDLHESVLPRGYADYLRYLAAQQKHMGQVEKERKTPITLSLTDSGEKKTDGEVEAHLVKAAVEQDRRRALEEEEYKKKKRVFKEEDEEETRETKLKKKKKKKGVFEEENRETKLKNKKKKKRQEVTPPRPASPASQWLRLGQHRLTRL